MKLPKNYGQYILPGIFIFFVLLKACNDPYEKVEKIEQIPDLENKLAHIDGDTDSTPYVKVLDAIQEKCYEHNRTALAAMARTLGKIEEADSGQKVSNLDSLKILYSEASTYANASEVKQLQCFDIVTEWKKRYKESAQEEAEMKKDEEIMDLGTSDR